MDMSVLGSQCRQVLSVGLVSVLHVAGWSGSAAWQENGGHFSHQRASRLVLSEGLVMLVLGRGCLGSVARQVGSCLSRQPCLSCQGFCWLGHRATRLQICSAWGAVL